MHCFDLISRDISFIMDVSCQENALPFSWLIDIYYLLNIYFAELQNQMKPGRTSYEKVPSVSTTHNILFFL